MLSLCHWVILSVDAYKEEHYFFFLNQYLHCVDFKASICVIPIEPVFHWVQLENVTFTLHLTFLLVSCVAVKEGCPSTHIGCFQLFAGGRTRKTLTVPNHKDGGFNVRTKTCNHL